MYHSVHRLQEQRTTTWSSWTKAIDLIFRESDIKRHGVGLVGNVVSVKQTWQSFGRKLWTDQARSWRQLIRMQETLAWIQVSRTNVRLIGNLITGGDHGIRSRRTGSYEAPGTADFRENEITGMYAYGLLERFDRDQSRKTTQVTMRSTSWSGSTPWRWKNFEGFGTSDRGNDWTGARSTGLRFQFNEGTMPNPGISPTITIQCSGSYALYLTTTQFNVVYHNAPNIYWDRKWDY